MNIGRYAKSLREKANLTQLQIAKQLGYTSSQFVSNWERDYCDPPVKALVLLSKVSGVNISDVKNTYKMEVSSRLEDEFKIEEMFIKRSLKKKKM